MASAPVPERFSDGSFRFSAGSTSFTFRRLRPGVMLTTITGFDRGELGEAPLQVIEAEARRFRAPVEWFIDARQTENAASPVFLRWTDWLSRNAGILRGLHVLTAAEPMRLTVAIARHIAGVAGVLAPYENHAAFESALAAAVPTYAPVSTEPQPIEWDVVREHGRVEVRTPRATWVLEPAPPSALVARVTGTEEGLVADVLFDEVERLIAALHPRPNWFVDLSRVRIMAGAAVDNWAAWLDVRRTGIANVHVLPPSAATGLLLTISRFRANLGGVIRLHASRDEFEAELRTTTAPAAWSGR